FLDEIGDMPLEAQAKLLRVLQERKVLPIGATTPEPVDVRVVSATHRDLDERVNQGEFRQDLLYRLRGLEIRLPRLNERTDLAAMLPRIMLDLSRSHRLSECALSRLSRADWNGNFRELTQCLKASIALADQPLITANALVGLSAGDAPKDLPSQTRAHHRDLIEAAIAAAGGNMTLAAKRLGISRATLYRKRAG
ncbi:MAG: sigma 54-interacting transcriptional regulator, partial [Litorivicinus sp.]